jgi:methionyl-tRNA formyltransferase
MRKQCIREYVKIGRMDLKIVFMGSPEIAASILRALKSTFPVAGVVTQPDRPAGRGRILTPPPVKILAEELGIPVIQPIKLRLPEEFVKLEQWTPDLIIVAAYGQILRKQVLDLPKFGCINVHASYLPRWRGAAPIQAAILSGDAYSGVSIMLMDEGIDTGPVLAQEKVLFDPDETSTSLSQKLSMRGGQLLLKTIPDYLAGKIFPAQQDESGATYAKMLTKEDGRIDLSDDVEIIERKVRAFSDWPGTFIYVDSQVLKIRKVTKIPTPSHQTGFRVVIEGWPAITTSNGTLLLLEVQPAGKRWMSGSDYLRGAQNWITKNL